MFFQGLGIKGIAGSFFARCFVTLAISTASDFLYISGCFFLFHLLEFKVPHVSSPNMPLGRNPMSCPPPPPPPAFPLTAPTGLQRPVSSRSWAARFRSRAGDVTYVGSTRTFRSGFRTAQARQLGAIGGQFEPERTDREGERGGLVHPCWQSQGGSAAFPGCRRRGAGRTR